jgi:predicted HAD superfamily Cof-like phosphohydrolase
MSHLSYYDNTQERAKLLNMTVTDMVTEFADLTSQTPNPELYEKLIAEEYDEWSKEFDDAHNELKELSDLVYVCYGYAKAKGWNLDEAIRRVHRNNVGRCLQPDGTVKRREDGKILKNPNFPKVDLKDCL